MFLSFSCSLDALIQCDQYFLYFPLLLYAPFWLRSWLLLSHKHKSGLCCNLQQFEGCSEWSCDLFAIFYQYLIIHFNQEAFLEYLPEIAHLGHHKGTVWNCCYLNYLQNGATGENTFIWTTLVLFSILITSSLPSVIRQIGVDGQWMCLSDYNLEMSYKANVDIVIALNALRITSFRKQGRLRFRLSLLRTTALPQTKSVATIPKYCTPYNIYKHPKQTQSQRVRHSQSIKVQSSCLEPSLIDHDQQCYYSRIFESKYQSQNHKIEECCYFRAYLSTDEIESARFAIRVELLFAADGQEQFVEAGTYEGTVHRISNICTFLPVIFDQFGGFTVSGLYQSTIFEYRFEGTGKQGEYLTFSHYLQAATHGLSRQALREFYDYYRGSLQGELFHIQERHSDLLRLLNIPANYGFIKVGPNMGLLNLMAAEGQGRGGLSRSRSRQHLWGGQELRERLADEITCDFNGLKGLIYQKWNEYVVFLAQRIEQLTQHFRSAYDANVRQRLKSHVFSHLVEPRFDWTFSRYEDSGKELLKQAEMDKAKQKDEELWRQAFPIENKDFFQLEGKTIKIFEEVCPVQQLRRILTQHPSRKPSFQLASSTVSQPSFSPSFSSQASFLPSKSHHQLLQSRSVLQFHGHSEKMIPECIGRMGMGMMNMGVGKGGQHIVIFVHGYQASRQDFVLFKSCLEVKYRCRVFISSANEGRTEESIENQGKRLAVQLNNFFKNVQFGPGTRVSFVGHSMGGIIIRSALTYIRNIEQYLWAYLSFSSPHLGYLYEPSALVQAGLWLLNTIQKSQSLDQLCMRDSEDPRRCFLYRLTENRSLDGFRQLALISSSQDEYVPYQSARIEKNGLLLTCIEGVTGSVIREMVDNLLGEARCLQISRMNVVFNIDSNNFDSLVGRTAHVKYLSDQKFIKMFTSVFDKFFA